MTARPLRRSRALEARPSRKISVRAIILLVAIAVVVLTLDQLAKWWVLENLTPGQPVHVVGNLLIFEFVRNSGAAFSIGTGSTWIFSIVAVAVLVFVVWYARRIRSLVWALVFGLVLGGLLGNLSDRLLRPPGFGVGEVIDFIRIPLLPAIFNLADSAIVCAMIIFLILTVMGIGLDGKRAGSKNASAVAAVDGQAGGDTAEHQDAASSGERDASADQAEPVTDASAAESVYTSETVGPPSKAPDEPTRGDEA